MEDDTAEADPVSAGLRLHEAKNGVALPRSAEKGRGSGLGRAATEVMTGSNEQT